MADIAEFRPECVRYVGDMGETRDCTVVQTAHVRNTIRRPIVARQIHRNQLFLHKNKQRVRLVHVCLHSHQKQNKFERYLYQVDYRCRGSTLHSGTNSPIFPCNFSALKYSKQNFFVQTLSVTTTLAEERKIIVLIIAGKVQIFPW